VQPHAVMYADRAVALKIELRDEFYQTRVRTGAFR
jgi:hypothetical protein